MKSLLHSSSFPLSISFHSLYNLKKSHAVNLKKWPNETHTVMKISKTISTIKNSIMTIKLLITPKLSSSENHLILSTKKTLTKNINSLKTRLSDEIV